jgi:hypothetical protein
MFDPELENFKTRETRAGLLFTGLENLADGLGPM